MIPTSNIMMEAELLQPPAASAAGLSLKRRAHSSRKSRPRSAVRHPSSSGLASRLLSSSSQQMVYRIRKRTTISNSSSHVDAANAVHHRNTTADCRVTPTLAVSATTKDAIVAADTVSAVSFHGNSSSNSDHGGGYREHRRRRLRDAYSSSDSFTSTTTIYMRSSRLMSLSVCRCQRRYRRSAFSSIIFSKTSPFLSLSSCLSLILSLLLLLCATPVVTAQNNNQAAPSSAPTAAVTTIVTVAPSTGAPTIPVPPTRPPTAVPTARPTTAQPSISPMPTTLAPTELPSTMPSDPIPLILEQAYIQTFLVPNNTFFDSDELAIFNADYTEMAEALVPASDTAIVDIFCSLEEQAVIGCNEGIVSCLEPEQNPGSDPVVLDLFLNNAGFICTWQSNSTASNVTQYGQQFEDSVNGMLDAVTRRLVNQGVALQEALPIRQFKAQTAAPTVSPMPTIAPTGRPTTSSPPTRTPSSMPTGMPVKSMAPSTSPTVFFTPQPTVDERSNTALRIGIFVIVGFGVLCLGLLFWYYKKRKSTRENRQWLPEMDARRRNKQGGNNTSGAGYNDGVDGDVEDGIHPLSPSESILSQKSMLSAGESNMDDGSMMRDSEDDGTNHLADDFDAFKNQNVEDLRTAVEGNVPGMEAIMSKAVTTAHLMEGGNNVGEGMLNDEDVTDTNDPTFTRFWGKGHRPKAEQVEASALCDVDDWMKRKGTATMEAKRAFMQRMLNNMVASVRSDVVDASTGSRTVHECAALLGLPLANKLPQATLLISGMRKAVAEPSITQVMREFGTMDVCVVAPGQRGFAIVRFRRNDSVDKVMNRFRSNEVVIQDVAVQMKALLPSGEVKGRVVELAAKGMEA